MNVPGRGNVRRAVNESPGSMDPAMPRPMPLQPATPSE
jgi:hypothetical protein